MFGTRNKWIFLLAVALVAGCTPNDRPNYDPVVFGFTKDNETRLLNSVGKVVDSSSSSFRWDQVESIVFRGRTLHKPSLDKLAPLGTPGRPDVLRLPIGDQWQSVYSWSALKLPTGNFLLSGGRSMEKKYDLDSVWLFDVKSGKVKEQGHLKMTRFDHEMTLLRDGRVLVSGGSHMEVGAEPISSCEMYDPLKSASAYFCNMQIARYEHTSVQLNNGKVLIVGGHTSSKYSDQPYLMISGVQELDLNKKTCSLIGRLNIARERPYVIPVEEDQALVFGGQGETPEPIRAVEILRAHAASEP